MRRNLLNIRLRSYVMRSDTGFAPAVDRRGRFLTLCTCAKPILKAARRPEWRDYDNWILATVGKGLERKSKIGNYRRVVYLARITEKPLTLGEYWERREFKEQKDRVYFPSANGKYNGYESVDWNPHGCDPKLMDSETKVDTVLVSREFYYFGLEPKEVDSRYGQFFSEYRQHRVFDSSNFADLVGLIEYARVSWVKKRNKWGPPTEHDIRNCRKAPNFNSRKP